MKEKLEKVKEELDYIGAEASSYAGCRCDRDDCGAGDCWPCRMMRLSERTIEPLTILDSLIAELDSPKGFCMKCGIYEGTKCPVLEQKL